MEYLPSIQKADLDSLFQANKELEAIAPQEAMKGYENLIGLAAEENLNIQVDSHTQLANLYRKQGLFYTALRHGGTAFQLINRHFPRDKPRLALCYKELGVIYADGLKKYGIAQTYFFKALECDVVDLQTILYNNIGSLYKDSKEYDKAITYLEKGRLLIPKEKDKRIHIFILENLGKVYLALGQNEKAIPTLREALKVSNQAVVTNKSIYYIRGYVLNALAEVYLESDRDNEAICLIEEALALAKEKKHLTVVIESLRNKAVYALRRGDEDMFFESINKAITYTEDENLAYEKDSCLEMLKDYYWSKQQYKKACLTAEQIILHKAKADRKHEANAFADVLEQRESQIMLLEEKNRMISRQKDELEQFAYIVAHDLKEPLRNIGNYSGLIKRRYAGQMDDEGEEFLNFIVNSTSHLYKMLDDLLQLQYATLKKEDLKKPADPNLVLEHITYRIKDKLAGTQSRIQYKALPQVPVLSIHLDILFDNLIKNAIKFRSKERPLCVVISAREEEHHFRFAVKDNGIGIDASYHESIFQIFRRLDRSSHKGTGIGLAICKKIVETYQGKIWVESIPGEGCIFYFTISK